MRALVLSGAKPAAHRFGLGPRVLSRPLTFAQHILNPSITGYKSPTPIMPSSATAQSSGNLGPNETTIAVKFLAPSQPEPHSPHPIIDESRQDDSGAEKPNHTAHSKTSALTSIVGTTAFGISMYLMGKKSVEIENTLTCNNCGKVLAPGAPSHSLWPGCAVACQEKEAREAEEDAIRAEERATAPL